MAQTVFNIERYGDFDIPVTVLTMLAPEGMGKLQARELARAATEMANDDRDTDRVCRFLKDRGFEPARTYNVQVGNNL